MRNINVLKEASVNLEQALEYLGDMEMYDETLQDFLNELDSRLPQLKSFLEIEDMPNYAILAHSTKSDAKYLGFTKLAELAYQHELAGKEGNILFVKEHYDEFMSEIEKCISLAHAYLKDS